MFKENIMWYKMIWVLGILAVVVFIGSFILIIPSQMELKQMREEAKATEKRLQAEGKHDHEHYHAENGTHTGISDLEQDTETTVEPNNPVNINESENMTETVASGTNSEKPRYKDGIYKGLTFSEAHVVWGGKYDKLSAKKDKIDQKIFELHDISNTLLDARKSLSLSFLRLIPTDQLEKAKEYALKSEPHKSDEIESFFNKIMNAENKTLESIKTDVQLLHPLEEVNREEWKKVRQESDKIEQAIDNLFLDMPTLLTKGEK